MDQMPQISYSRSHKNSYMIIEGGTDTIGYEEQMLRQNEVTMLLAFYTVEMNRRIQIWYEISGKRSMKSLIEQEGLTVEKLRMILGAIYTSIKGIRNYLIPDEHIYLSRDTIFFEKSSKNWEAYLCWCPFPLPSTAEQIRAIMEYFMKAVEKERDEVSELCQKLYEKSLEEASLEQLVEVAALYHSSETYEGVPSAEYSDPGDEENHDISGPVSDHYTKKEISPISDSGLTDKVTAFMQTIRDYFNGLLGRPAVISPHPVPDEGLIIFEPDTDFHEPTTLIRTDDREFTGELVYEGGGEEKNYLIDKDTFNIGARSDDNDANLNSPVVSRHHARITRDEGGYYIEDLNSTNGTYVNDRILSFEEKVRLNRADRIRFADVMYRII